MLKQDLESADIDRGLRFLLDRKCLQAVNREDGRAVQPSTAGLEYLAAHERSENAKTEWTLDRRLVLYGVIVALIAVLAALAVKLWLL